MVRVGWKATGVVCVTEAAAPGAQNLASEAESSMHAVLWGRGCSPLWVGSGGVMV